jgi:hypothetical protein
MNPMAQDLITIWPEILLAGGLCLVLVIDMFLRDSHRDIILRSYVLDGNILSWDEMSVFGKTSLGNESSYNAGFAFVYYLA